MLSGSSNVQAAEAPSAEVQDPSAEAPTTIKSSGPSTPDRRRDERNLKGRRRRVAKMEEDLDSSGKTGRAVLGQRAQLEKAKD